MLDLIFCFFKVILIKFELIKRTRSLQRHIIKSIKKKSESEVAQSCLTLCDPMDCSPPGSSVHGILQARILEWVAISFPRIKSIHMHKDFAKVIFGHWPDYCSWYIHLKYNLIFLHCICQRGKKLKEGNIHKRLTEKKQRKNNSIQVA